MERRGPAGNRRAGLDPSTRPRHVRCVFTSPFDTFTREHTMADDRNSTNRDRQSSSGNDSEDALRDELERENKEAKGGIGDIAEDRNLSGSSSWLTEPKDEGDRSSGSSGSGGSNQGGSRR